MNEQALSPETGIYREGDPIPNIDITTGILEFCTRHGLAKRGSGDPIPGIDIIICKGCRAAPVSFGSETNVAITVNLQSTFDSSTQPEPISFETQLHDVTEASGKASLPVVASSCNTGVEEPTSSACLSTCPDTAAGSAVLYAIARMDSLQLTYAAEPITLIVVVDCASSARFAKHPS